MELTLQLISHFTLCTLNINQNSIIEYFSTRQFLDVMLTVRTSVYANVKVVKAVFLLHLQALHCQLSETCLIQSSMIVHIVGEYKKNEVKNIFSEYLVAMNHMSKVKVSINLSHISNFKLIHYDK
jgi:hypothetical protein